MTRPARAFHFLLRRTVVSAIFGAVLSPAFSPALAQALPPISTDRFINDSLRAAAIADSIRRACPSISARFIVAYRKLRELEAYARAKGYSEAEAKAFVRSGRDRARLLREARAYQQAHGVVEGRKETYCALGRAEIARGSLIGQLLWSWK